MHGAQREREKKKAGKNETEVTRDAAAREHWRRGEKGERERERDEILERINGKIGLGADKKKG